MNIVSRLLSAVGFALLLAVSANAETISPKEANSYVGHSVTVEGVVSQVSTSGRGTTFINFGGRYPNQTFYAVIFRSNARNFSGVQSLEGQTVAISGTIELYKGRPEIVLSSPRQIAIRP